jgi:hypothetical protein
MKKKVLGIAAALATAAGIVAGSAFALQGGAPDGNAHPYVGMSAYPETQTICSGTLISPETYITAAHCAGVNADGNAPTFVLLYFGERPASGLPSAVGIPVADPEWTGSFAKGDTHDIGVVQLAIPYPGPYAQIAPAGYVDGLTRARGQKDTSFTTVGYGVYDITPKVESWVAQRWAGTTQLQTTDAYNLRMTASPGNGTGGAAACYGDSGGAVLQGNTLLGVISAGTKYCMGSAAAYRVDTPGARAFLASQGVALP